MTEPKPWRALGPTTGAKRPPVAPPPPLPAGRALGNYRDKSRPMPPNGEAVFVAENSRYYTPADGGPPVLLGPAPALNGKVPIIGQPKADEPEENEQRALARVAIQLAKPKAAKPGGSWMLDVPSHPPVVWGNDDHVAWTQGEYITFVGPGGVGKSTIVQQIALARAGILPAEFLGMTVTQDGRRLLYLALDRAAQIRRSFHRMVTEEHRAALDERVTIWDRRLPLSLVKNPEVIAALALDLDAGTVVVDSLKDLAGALSNEEVGQAVKEAFQAACDEGIELGAINHVRKKAQGVGNARSADDTYGSVHIYNGAGSVVLIDGTAGDAVVEMRHIKQPTGDGIGPWQLLHDHDRGVTTRQHGIDLLAVVRTSNGLNPEGAARALFTKDKPSPNEVEKARRQLDRLVAKGLAVKKDGGRSAVTGQQQPARYWATTKENQQ